MFIRNVANNHAMNDKNSGTKKKKFLVQFMGLRVSWYKTLFCVISLLMSTKVPCYIFEGT